MLVQLSSRLANNQSSKWASVDSAQSSRLRVSLNNKEKAKQKYLAAIHHFDNHVRDDYVVVSKRLYSLSHGRHSS